MCFVDDEEHPLLYGLSYIVVNVRLKFLLSISICVEYTSGERVFVFLCEEMDQKCLPDVRSTQDYDRPSSLDGYGPEFALAKAQEIRNPRVSQWNECLPRYLLIILFYC